jgi:parvulin-like peptidyl-prolyl isomerase
MKKLRLGWGLACLALAYPGWATSQNRVLDRIEIWVGPEIITSSEIEEPLRLLRANLSSEIKGEELEKKLDEARKTHIQRLIESKLILLEARAQKLEVQDAMVEEQAAKEIENLRAQFKTEEAFKAQMALERLSESELKTQREKIARDNFMRQKLLQGKLQEFKTDAVISEDRLKAYYAEHPEEFQQSGRAKIRQIFFTPGPDGATQLAAARRALAAGRAFEEVARAYSQHKPSAENGGEIGWVQSGDLDSSALDKAIFKTLQPGAVSEPIVIERGTFIFKLEERESGRQLPFEEVRGQIRQRIMAEGSETRYLAWIEGLKGKYPIRFNEHGAKADAAE